VNATSDTSPNVVYECPECEERYLDERRCPDCQLFCRRLGTGGPCPHCDELVSLSELAPQEATMATT
jgi:hypothetical protein